MKFEKIILFFTILLLSIIYYFMLPTSNYLGLPLGDTPIFEYFGYAMTKGELMYSNLFDHKGPIIFIAHCIGWFIYGEMGVKILFACCVFVFLFFVYRISKIYISSYEYLLILIVVFIAFITISERGLNVETLALPFITMALYFYLELFENKFISNIRIIFLGLSFGIVFFIRANMVGVWMLMTLVYLFTLLKHREFKKILNYVLFFFVGMFAVLIPLMLYFIFTDTFNDMLYQAFYINFMYAGGEGVGKKKILLWSVKTLIDMGLLFFAILANIIKPTNKKTIFYNMIVVVLLFLAIMSKREYLHYLIVVIPLFVPYVSIVFSKLSSYKINFYKICVVLIGGYLFYNTNLTYLFDSISNRGSIDKNIDNVGKYIKQNSNEEDRIYTHRLTGAIYIHSERLASNKYFFIPSISDNLYIDDFKKNMEENRPKYIVISDRFFGSGDVDKYVKNLVNGSMYKLAYNSEHLSVYRLTK